MIRKFGEVLFSGSRLVFWTVSPLLILFVVGLAHWAWPWSNALDVALVAIAVLLIFVLYDVKRFWWAARGVTTIVFLFCVVDFAAEIHSKKPWQFGEDSPLEALLGLLIVGLPCLRYTFAGSFGPRRREAVAANLSVPCPHCAGPISDHAWTMFACTVASDENKARVQDFEGRIKSHDWISLRKFSEWEGTKNNLNAVVLRCGSGGAVLVLWDPFELWDSQQVCSVEKISPAEMSVIEDLIRSTGWSPAPPSFLNDLRT